MKRQTSFALILSNQKVLLAICLGAAALLGARLLLVIKTYAVNVFFVDQWDVYATAFYQWGIWQTFSQQYGPHRQGMGGLLIRAMAPFSQMNATTDAFVSFGLVFLAMLSALFLKWRIFHKWSLSDAIIPVIFLTVSQFETFIITPNVAHSAFPLLLVMLYSLAWTLQNRPWRTICILVLNFAAMYTGFSIFIGLITPALLLVEFIQALRLKDNRRAGITGGAAAIAGFTAYYFFHDYAFAPAVSCFSIKASFLPKYPVFMSVILGRFFGIDFAEYKWLCIGVGIVFLAAMGVVLLVHGWQIIKKGNTPSISLILTALSGYSLIFLLNAAVGRLCLGMAAAYTSRYVTLAIPGLLAIYLYLLTIQRPRWRTALVAVFFLFTAVSLPLKAGDISILEYFANGKTAWKACYLEIENVETCDEKTNFWVYPPLSLSNPVQVQAFKDKLSYIKQHHLNLYLDQPGP